MSPSQCRAEVRLSRHRRPFKERDQRISSPTAPAEVFRGVLPPHLGGGVLVAAITRQYPCDLVGRDRIRWNVVPALIIETDRRLRIGMEPPPGARRAAYRKPHRPVRENPRHPTRSNVSCVAVLLHDTPKRAPERQGAKDGNAKQHDKRDQSDPEQGQLGESERDESAQIRNHSDKPAGLRVIHDRPPDFTSERGLHDVGMTRIANSIAQSPNRAHEVRRSRQGELSP